MMTRHFVEAVIKKGWKPYIDSHWINFSAQRGGVILTFKGHEDHKFKCSNKVAQDLLSQYDEARIK